jgi:hypothetical protein
MATRVTVANNAKQSQKAPLVLPAAAITDPAAAGSMQSLVFKTAQSKLKLKKPTRVFVKQTGQELVNEKDWKDNIRSDAVLLVSTGEEYVGVKKEIIIHGKCTVSCSSEMTADKSSGWNLRYLRSTTLEILRTTSNRETLTCHAVFRIWF